MLRELASEFFASRGLGRPAAEKWPAQDLGDNPLKYRARSCDAAVAIVGLAEEAFRDRIDHHVAGAGVESGDLFRGCGRRDRSQVRDPADVLHNAADLPIAVEQVIEKGNQGRALASGGHVGRTEIGHDGNACARGNHGAFSGLPGDGQLAAQEFRGLALVIESLAVAADEFYFQAETALGGEYRFGIEFSQQKIQAGKIGHAGLCGVHGLQDGLADGFRVRVLGLGQEFETWIGWVKNSRASRPRPHGLG